MVPGCTFSQTVMPRNPGKWSILLESEGFFFFFFFGGGGGVDLGQFRGVGWGGVGSCGPFGEGRSGLIMGGGGWDKNLHSVLFYGYFCGHTLCLILHWLLQVKNYRGVCI